MRLVPPCAAFLLAVASFAAACGTEEAAVPRGGAAADPDAGATSSGGGDDAGGSSADAAGDGGAIGPTTEPCTGKTGASGDRTIDITSPAGSGTKRSFDLHVPAKYDPKKPTPLVFVFHGYTMTASGIASASKFAATADAHGMIVAFPSGTSGGFNAGECCGSAVTSKVDDLGFTRDMVSSISREYCVDAKRVYSTGFSNGGFMSYYLACEMSETFAAVASVSGTLGIPPASCKPKRAISLLHIHGTGDLVVPYIGGGVGANRSVATSVDTFRTIDKCPAGDGAIVYTKGDVECSKWSCDASTAVELCNVTNGGHQWPGGEQLPYGGIPSPNLDASETIATFFDQHRLP